MTIIDAAPEVRPNTERFTPIPKAHAATEDARELAKLYADWTTVYKFTKSEVFYEESEAGDPYRFAGGVQLSYGTKTFVVFLKRGATEVDLSLMHIVVEDVKAGLEKRYPWTVSDSKKYPGTEFRSLTIGTAMSPEKFEAIRPYKRCLIVQCQEEGCTSSYHQPLPDDPMANYVLHTAAGGVERDGYTVKLTKYGQEPWKVSCGGDLDMLPTVAASLVNDISWLAAEARRLNAKLGY